MKIFDFTFYWIHISPSYYGLAYAISFIIWYIILKKRKFIKEDNLDSLLMYIFFWVIFWWRLWYILFYNFSYYFENPLKIFYFWNWWMSFHWWVIWVMLAVFIFSIKHHWNENIILKRFYLILTDNIVTVLPIWLGFWRIGNYLNKELLWMQYNWFLAVEKNWISYFPSPLLESFFEWIILFFILRFIFIKSKFLWETSWAFLFYYWIFRFFIEFIRLPDVQIGYILNYFTLWQVLSIPMILFWLYFYFFNKKFPNE